MGKRGWIYSPVLVFVLVAQEKASDCAGSYTDFRGSTAGVLSGGSRVGRN